MYHHSTVSPERERHGTAEVSRVIIQGHLTARDKGVSQQRSTASTGIYSGWKTRRLMKGVMALTTLETVRQIGAAYLEWVVSQCQLVAMSYH